MDREDFSKILPPRKPDSHKGDYGHLLVLAGSVGLTGAACLASQAALLVGGGLVTLGIPKSLNPIVEAKLTEVMTKPLAETQDQSLNSDSYLEISRLTQKVDALVIGPGLSRNRQTQALVRKLIISINLPIVLDADGINALIDGLGILKKVKSPFVLTPHPGEMARLKDMDVGEVQANRESLARSFAKEHSTLVVLKGFHTVVANSDGEVYINQTGNPGMATAGSGDILTGMIGSFISQKIDSFNASKLAVYLHGLAGDLAAEERGQVSLIASDILYKLPEAIKSVTGR